jgi:hypothetical protein
MKALTPHRLAAFEAAVSFWQDRLNLHDWRIKVKGQKDRTAHASVGCDTESRIAVCRIAPDDKNAPSVDYLALHEMLHVLVWEMTEAYQNPAMNTAQRQSAEHRVINTLVKLLIENKPEAVDE